MSKHYLSEFMLVAILFLAVGEAMGSDYQVPMAINIDAIRGVERGDVTREMAIGLGPEVVQVKVEQLKEEISDEWTLFGNMLIGPVQFIERDGLGENVPTKDWSTLGMVSLGWVKRDEVISVSVLGTLSSFEDSGRIYHYGWSADTFNTQDYYFADVRYHRVINENMSTFFGYKVGAFDWEWAEYEVDDPSYWEEEGLSIGHGPLVGINIFHDLKGTSFSLSGSVAFMPIGAVHKTIDITTNVYEDEQSDDAVAWFVNPQLGIRWETSETSSASFGWLWHLVGDYSDGASEIMHGLTASLAYKF